MSLDFKGWAVGMDHSPRSPTRRELSDRLGMSREEGERWIVDLVRDARLDAKIDFKEVRPVSHWTICSAAVLTSVALQNTVQMNHSETPVYQSVIERSKGLLFRAQAMASAMEIRAGACLNPPRENSC